MGSRQDDQCVFRGSADIEDISANALSTVKTFPENLFPARQNSFCISKINYQVTMFHAMYDAIDDLTFFILVLVVDQFYFCFADFLDNHLLGKLRSDAAVVFHDLLNQNLISYLNIFGKGSSFFKTYFFIWVFNFFNHCFFKINFHFPSGLVELTLKLSGCGITLSSCDFNRCFQGIDQHIFVDAFIPAQLFQNADSF